MSEKECINEIIEVGNKKRLNSFFSYSDLISSYMNRSKSDHSIINLSDSYLYVPICKKPIIKYQGKAKKNVFLFFNENEVKNAYYHH